MEQATDHLNAVRPKPLQPLVAPGEVELGQPVGGDPLPKYGKTHRLRAHFREQVDILDPGVVTRLRRLIPIIVADPNHRAFGTRPQLERRPLD
jgi:hypothetical protein